MERFKLSDTQKRQLFTFQGVIPKSSISLTVSADCDLDQFHTSVIKVVRNQKVFRASLVEVPELKLPLQEVSEITISQQKVSLNTWIHIGNLSYFINHVGEKYKIQFTIPAIFSDVQSLSILVQTIFTSDINSDHDFDYIQFAAWQNKYLQSLASHQKDFWEQRVSFKKLFSTPIHSIGNTQSKEHFCNSAFDNADVLEKVVQKIVKKTGFNSEEILLACWSILIHKNTQEDTLALGLNDDGRFFEELENIIGSFENWLPFSLSFHEEIRFADVINEINKEFELLGEHLETFHGNTSYEKNNYFEVGYRYSTLESQEIEIQEIHQPDFSSNILLDVFKFENTTQYAFQYNTNKYSEKSIEILKEQFLVIVKEAFEKTEKSIKHWKTTYGNFINIIDSFHQSIEPETDQSIPQVFQKLIDQSPNTLALIDHSEEITYKELDQKVRSLAVQIQKSKGERVALFLDSDKYIPIAMLAVLYSGKSYVPISTDTPKLRLEFILKNADIGTIISKKEHQDKVSKLAPKVIFIEDEREVNLNEFTTRSIEATSPAYHIYTSGTTGFPKGVSISHKALINYVQWISNEFGIQEGDRSALLTSYAFDLGYTALWGTLLNGGTLFMPTKEVTDDATSTLNYIKKNKLTFLKVTPSLLNVWYETDSRALFQCNELRYIFSGGEAFDSKVLKKLAKINPKLEFINHYGPTETTIGAIAKRISAKKLTHFEQHTTIGKPIQNMQAIIVDENQCVLPPGIEGQLYISGHGLANTYLKQDSLWEEKCIQINSFPHLNWYDTGDRAIWTEKGEIIYVGRKDTQLKVRGFRIELSEIESILEQHPSISRAAVYQDISNPNRLIASVVPNEQAKSLAHFCQHHRESTQSWSRLPNGSLLFEINRAETAFMYQELTSSNVYSKHGIKIQEGDTIVDLGANIGLFGLSKVWEYNDLKLISVEPAPRAFECLKRNATLYDVDWKVFQVAVGAEQQQCSFSSYKHHSLLSTLKPDIEEDRALLLKLATSKYEKELDKESEQSLKKITESQLVSETIHCDMWTLSKLIDEANIETIDLLKVDVQRAEYDVLLGLEANDWKKIGQIVMEVQDGDSRLKKCVEILTHHNFEVIYEQEADFQNSDRYLLYAKKKGYIGSKRTSTTSIKKNSPVSCDPIVFIDQLKEFVAEYLPEVFYPSEYRLMDHLPITSNGKLDRKSLLKAPYFQITEQKTLPEVGLQMRLADIWKEVLQLDSTIYLEDNFFDLGGHSLKSVRIVNQIKEELNAELSMADLLRFPRFEDFASLVVKKLLEGKKDQFNIQEAASFPLLPMQKQMWFLAQMEAANVAYNMMRVIEIKGELEVSYLQEALQLLIKKHEVLRTQFLWENELKQKILEEAEALSKFKFIEKESTADEELQYAIEEENRLPFDFKKDLFFRSKLIKRKKDDYVLVLCAHHIICDGVSFEILIAELFRYYQQLVKGERPDIKNKIGYRASVAHVLNRISNQSKSSTDFWRQNFAGNWEELKLPLNQSRKAILNFEGEKYVLSFSKTTSEKFESLASQVKVSSYALAVALLKLVLHHWTGSKEMTIGSTVAGRDSEKIENQVGYFANTIVLRDFIEEEKKFKEYVSQVSQNVLNALHYQYLELENISKETNILRRNGMAVLFDVGLTWYMHENFEDWNQLLESVPIQVTQLDLTKPPARSDLWFFVYKKDEELVWEIIYNKSLFHQQTIADFGELFSKIFDQIIENSNKKISEYADQRNSIHDNLEFGYELNI